MNTITSAIETAGGITKLASACGVSYQAVRRWEHAGRLPRTELTGETDYARAIARATHGKITRRELLDITRQGWARRA